jgi:hypothetical protein
MFATTVDVWQRSDASCARRGLGFVVKDPRKNVRLAPG